MQAHKTILVLILLAAQSIFFSQNENKQWYFGDHAGLDFTSSPPTILLNSANNSLFGCSTISDATGALLFYTDGLTVYDKTHNVMANGTGLGTTTNTNALQYQHSAIVKQPGTTNLYFIITNCYSGSPVGIFYSIVDMSLAAGMGSVTVKNATLSLVQPSGQMTVARHCNEKDFWLVSHDYGNPNFRVFLISSTGVSTVPVVSTLGYNGAISSFVRISPNGKKIATEYNSLFLTLYDFDPATAQITNSMALSGNSGISYDGLEFSPDGTKLYTSSALSSTRLVSQFDLCAGSTSAIIASQYTIAATNLENGIQLAPNGKIYVARNYQNALGVINNPNASGAACNYVDNGQSVAPKICRYGFPGFIQSLAPSPQFTNNIQCQLVSFTNTAATSTAINNCIGYTNSLTSCFWNFGDPLSASSNTSTTNQPQHFYSGPGTYTVKLMLHYPCRTDSLIQSINIVNANPNFSLSGPSSICKGETHTLTVSNSAYQYTWSSGGSGTMAVVSPSANIVYSVTTTNTINGCGNTKTLQVTVNKCLGLHDANYAAENIVIYPNPTSEHLLIESHSQAVISIYNQLGELVLTRILTELKSQIEISTLPNGFYFVRIKNANGVFPKSFIKTD